MHAGLVEGGLVMGNVAVNVLQRPLQPLGLQGDDFVAAGVFYGV